MPIDTSIYGQIRPFRIRDPLELERNALAVEAAQQSNQLNALKFDEMRRAQADAQADQETMRAYYQAGGGEGNLNALNVRPRLRAAEEKRLIDLAKDKAETEARRASTGKTTQETLDARLKTYRTALDFIDTPQAAARWTEAQFNDPIVSEFVQRNGSLEDMVRSIPTDPQQFQQWRQQSAMGMEKFLTEQRLRQTERRQAINEPVMLGPDGQPMVNRAAVEAKSQIAAAGAPVTYGSPIAVTLPDGTPALAQPGNRPGAPPQVMRITPGGTPLRPSADSKPPTEGQSKAVLFGSRMSEADQVIRSLGEKGVNMPSIVKQGAESVPVIGGALGAAANFAQTPEQQQVEQAQRDFINAVLRRESGAVIAESEFANARRQYFPQPGDSPTVIKQKAKNRTTALEGMKVEAGPHWRDVSGTTQGTQPMPRQPPPRPANRPAAAQSGGGWIVLGVE